MKIPVEASTNECFFCEACEDRPAFPLLICNSLAKKYTAGINKMINSQSVKRVLDSKT